MANVIFKVGTKALFDALEQKDTNTLYWLEDVQELYKGNLLFATGKTASETAAGLMSADDKIKLDSLSPGTLTGLTPVDASVIIADGEDGKTIGVQLSKEAGNTIVLKTDGLFAAGTQAPEFAIEKQGEATEGYAATYRLKRTLGDETTYVGDSINIPKDLVVQSGSVKTVTEADQPYEGAEVGDTYIDLQLNDSASSHIYIPAKGLIDTSDFVVQVIESQNGEAIIQNEPTGGGAKFHHTDGTESFVGVNDGGENGMVAQIYVTDAIAALNIGDYATAAQLTALAGRVTTLEGASHTHANKELLDTYTQTEANLADAVAKKHTHANATELDKIANGDKAKWDAAEQNAKDYADSLASDYDAAGSAAEALADAKEYTDTALTWGSF